MGALNPFAKAVIAFILAAAGLAGQFGIAVPEFINEEALTSIALALIPIFVFFVPNKPTVE